MQKIWILGNSPAFLAQSSRQVKSAEYCFAESLEEIEKELEENERFLLLAPLPAIADAEKRWGKRLAAAWPLQGDEKEEIFFHAIHSLLQESKLQHDLDAAESVAWSGTHGGGFEDSGIEFLGQSILEISACRNMQAVEKALLQICNRIAATEEIKIIEAPGFLPIREMGRYQLAVPVQHQNELLAHVYARFAISDAPIEQVGGALLNLGDAIALAVERNRMISKAEQTKKIWEASFDAVTDPVVILDEEYNVLRANRSFGKLVQVPITRVQGNECMVIEKSVLQENAKNAMREWDLNHDEKVYRVFFDAIQSPLGAGRFVLRLHEVTRERSLTEKILAREQIAEMGILAGSVAHEINNPIGGIIAFSQLLLKDIPANSPMHADFTEILSAAERCKRIVQTMLSLVRKADEEKKSTDILECIHLAKEIIEAEAKRISTKIRISGDTKAWHLLGNKNQIVQVFFHLFQQSLHAIADRKSNEKFSAEIHVSLEQSGDRLVVFMEDNGATEIHVYDAGSSVAFAVSKMIVEEHGGSVSLHCTDNQNQQKIIFPLLDTAL